MKKVFKKAALAALGLSLVAGSAQAVVLTINNGNAPATDNAGPAYLANEANGGVVLNLAGGLDAFGPFDTAAVGSGGSIIVTTGVVSPQQIAISMDNADFVPAPAADNYYLFPWTDADNDGAITYAEIGPAVASAGGVPIVGTVDAAGDITFVGPLNVAGGGLVPAGTKLVLAADSDGTASAAANMEAVIWATDASLAADATITATVTETDSGGTDATSTAVAGQFMNEYALCVPAASTAFDGIIDLAPPAPAGIKTQFTVATAGLLTRDVADYAISDRDAVDTSAAATGCADSVDYSGKFFLTQLAGGGAVDDITVVLKDSVDAQALSAAGVAGAGMTETAGPLALTYATATGWTSATTDVVPGSLGFTFQADVDGNDIDVRTFDVSVVSVPLATFPAITYTLPAGSNAGSWTLGQGYDGIITYFPVGYPGYNAFLKATNRNTSDSTLTINGQCETGGVQSTVTGSLNDIPANSHVTYSSADIVTALGLDAALSYQCSLELIGSAPATLLQISGIQIGPDGRTALPLYNIADSNLDQ